MNKLGTPHNIQLTMELLAMYRNIIVYFVYMFSWLEKHLYLLTYCIGVQQSIQHASDAVISHPENIFESTVLSKLV